MARLSGGEVGLFGVRVWAQFLGWCEGYFWVRLGGLVFIVFRLAVPWFFECVLCFAPAY
jgi:hypothetical protein